MALTQIVKRFDSNSFKRTVGGDGDIVFAIYDIDVAAGGNAYPAGGEPISFAADFREVHSVSLANFGASTLGAWDNQIRLPVYDLATVNTGTIKIYVGAGGANGFPQHAAGAYSNAFQFSLLVVGRPATDQQ